MSYINCGAFVHGVRPRTKKALKAALTQDPDSVRFDCTSFLGSHLTHDADQHGALQRGDTLTVVGPDPYTKRSWYASVTMTSSGKIVVK